MSLFSRKTPSPASGGLPDPFTVHAGHDRAAAGGDGQPPRPLAVDAGTMPLTPPAPRLDPAAAARSARRAASDPAQVIETLVRARYPLLYVVTWEEERAMAALARVAANLGKKTFDWTIVQGLARYRGGVEGPVEGKKGTKDPAMALREALNNLADPSLFVFRDFHNFMGDSSVKRTLRDAALLLRSSSSTIVILSPVLKLPDELEKDMTLVDFPLPGRDDIEALLEQIAADTVGNFTLKVDLSDESRSALVDAAVGLTLNEAENVFARTLVSSSRLGLAQAPMVYAEKRQVVRKSGLLEYVDATESLGGVGGLDNLKAWLARRRPAMDARARATGLPAPRGVLLVGVQGCGKSLAAKATARELGSPLVRLDVGRLYSKMVGETEANVRRALALAEAVAPVVLWIDELEKGLSGVGSSDSTDGGTSSRLFGTILTWLQEKEAPVFVVATANDIEALPPEVLRKGRFDEIFFVDLPAPEERRQIFAIHLRKRGSDPDAFDLDLLADSSEGFSGAEIEQSIIEAMFDVLDVKPAIESADVLGALRRLVPLSRTMRRSVRDRRLWAVGRTVYASSARGPEDSLKAPDPDDAAKETLYMEHVAMSRAMPMADLRDLESYLGPFPGRDADLERMRIYADGFRRMAERIRTSR